jgi:hypothetical protein
LVFDGIVLPDGGPLTDCERYDDDLLRMLRRRVYMNRSTSADDACGDCMYAAYYDCILS